jgi:drug/metabolite transporter (DMT)-like permease
VDRRRALGVALVVLSACAFGSGALFAKPVYALGVDWHVLSSWRFLFGALAAWAWLLLAPGAREGLRRLSRRAALVALALGVLYVGNSGTYYAGLETVSASLAALIVYVYPAVVAVLTLRFGRRLEGRRAWAGLALALTGVGLSVGGIPAGAAPPLLGLTLIVLSPLIYSVWIVLAARLSGERRSGHVLGGAEAAATTALIMTATAAVYWASALVVGREVLPAAVPAAAWPGLLGVGVIATFVAMQAFYAGAQRVGAAQASLLSTVEPIWTILLAWLLLAERLGAVQLLGGAFVILGVVLAQLPAASIRKLGRGPLPAEAGGPVADRAG